MENSTTTKQEIWLIRHGASLWNKEQIHQGQSYLEPGLAPEGISQAAAIGRKLKSEKIAAIYASPLPRTVQTARVINLQLDYLAKIFTELGLKEITHGVVDGTSYQTIFTKYSEGWKKWLDREIRMPLFPGGESQLEAQARMIRAMYVLARASNYNYRYDQKIIVVAHGGVNKLFLAHISGLPIKNHFDIAQENGCINILLWDGEEFFVKEDKNGKPMINLTEHLGEHRFSPGIKT